MAIITPEGLARRWRRATPKSAPPQARWRARPPSRWGPSALTAIAVTPADPTIPKGTTRQFTATGTYSDGGPTAKLNSVSWSTANSGVASISAGGLVSAVTLGTATISGSSGTASGSTVATVGPPALAAIAVTPASPTMPKGTTRQVTATGTYSDGSTADITSSVTWASSKTAVATISPGGLALAVAKGNTKISATSSPVAGSTTLTAG